jgi:hypothetical protein
MNYVTSGRTKRGEGLSAEWVARLLLDLSIAFIIAAMAGIGDADASGTRNPLLCGLYGVYGFVRMLATETDSNGRPSDSQSRSAAGVHALDALGNSEVIGRLIFESSTVLQAAFLRDPTRNSGQFFEV